MHVRFRIADTAILFCIPEAGCSLNYSVERYTCFERIGVLTYEVVAGCVDRAVRAGAMTVTSGELYRLTPEWYSRVHRWNPEFAASELAMIEVSDELVLQEWPAIEREYMLPEPEFERAVEHTRHYLVKLFASYKRQV